MVDCCSAPGLMPFEEAKQNLLNTVNTVTETEKVDIELADSRVLSAPVVSSLNVPAHNNSAMDGYAIRADELTTNTQTSQTHFKLVGTAYAGQPFHGNLENGECIRIMTGAVVPDSANAVEMQENVDATTEQSSNTVILKQQCSLHNHIRKAGEDIAQGQTIFETGHKLKAVDIGLLASLGVAKVPVYRKLKVAVFSTGDELKSPGQTLSTGDIYESNRYVLIAMLERMNLEVIDMGIISDDKALITQAFIDADKNADAVISSGGVSVGDADYTKEVLDELGDIGFWKVAMKPGKPFAFGQLPNSIFFGLPGNPVSATVTFHQLAAPALMQMSGSSAPTALSVAAITTDRIRKRPGRMDFQRGIAELNAQGQLTVTPLGNQGSGILSSLSKANCYIVLAQENGGYNQGESVEIQLFDQLLS